MAFRNASENLRAAAAIPSAARSTLERNRRGLIIARVTAARHFILGTAGHIDHGKTSLVCALTGTDPDRLPEEKRRGMTIELGFAELRIGDTRFGVVDVPGHERFVRTMVSGATGIDVAVLVVAADDSVMPQTVEHVDILTLLGVQRLVVALTKIDAVDPSLVELVGEDVRALLSATPFAGAAICPVSSVTGAGLEELKKVIHRATASMARRDSRLPFRMAIDRVFTVQGRGTVVTGSVLRGQVAPGDGLELFPGSRTCRVRDLQTHGTQQELLARGQRAALNLSGIDKEDVVRGGELATPGFLQPARIIDVRLHCLPSFGRPLESSTTAHLEIGTTDVPVRVVPFEGEGLAPGSTGFAQLRSGVPVTVVHGQRFILRDASAMRTMGGGVVLRPVARRKRGDSPIEVRGLGTLESHDPLVRVEEVLRAAGFSRPSDLQLCARAGVEPEEVPGVLERLERDGRWNAVAGTEVRATPGAVEQLIARLASWLERFHRAHPEQPGRAIDTVIGWLERVTFQRAIARPLFDLLVRQKTVKCLGRFACLPAFAPALSAADERLMQTIVAAIRQGRFQPPAPGEVSFTPAPDRKRLERVVTLAVALGELVPIAPEIHLHAESEAELRGVVSDLVARSGPVTVAQIREALGSSRKYVVPFVEYLDRVGFTQRVGDTRVVREPAKAHAH